MTAGAETILEGLLGDAGLPPGRRGGESSSIAVTYHDIAGRAAAERVRESGSLRIRHPRGRACQAIVVNTAGGVVAGDRLHFAVSVGAEAAVTLTTAAAEKIYRSEGALSTIATTLDLATASNVAWIPQETILFDGIRLRRRFEVDMAEDACLVASEIVVFGRAASGESNISGSFHDSWRVRRAGRLVFADETRLEGRIGAVLGRAAVARGAGACALMLIATPENCHRLSLVRSVIETWCRNASLEGGASLRDGIIVARFVAQSGEMLRCAVADVLREAGGTAVPRVWQ